jgi:hypothetical protein
MLGGGVGGWINIWMGDFNMWFTYMRMFMKMGCGHLE